MCVPIGDLVRTNTPHDSTRLVLTLQNMISEVFVKFRGVCIAG